MKTATEFITTKSGLTGRIVKESWQKYKIRIEMDGYFMDRWVNKVDIATMKVGK